VWFDTDSLVTASIELPDDYDQSRGMHFYERLLTAVRAIPGVSAAALADALPAGENPSPRGESGGDSGRTARAWVERRPSANRRILDSCVAGFRRHPWFDARTRP
jgi:hypothetical protein